MRLHFQSVGEGPVLIILHGMFGSSDNWQPMARKFSPHFRVLAVDQRNHGRSPHSAEMNYPAMAEDLAELMQAEGIDRAHILGHSLGGKTAMQFALSHPARVEKLLIADMAPRAYPPLHREIFEALLALDLAKFQTRNQVGEALAPDIPNPALRLFLLKSVGRNPDGTLFWQTNIRDISNNSLHLRAALPETPPFTGPTLFVRGEKSHYILDEDIPLIQRMFPAAEVRTIANAGHWVHVEAPDAFFQLAQDFLRK